MWTIFGSLAPAADAGLAGGTGGGMTMGVALATGSGLAKAAEELGTADLAGAGAAVLDDGSG
jgi:hypothetical protein